MVKDSIEYIKNNGGVQVYAFAPHILIGYIWEDAVSTLVGKKNIKSIHYNSVDPSIVEEYGKADVYAVELWNRR